MASSFIPKYPVILCHGVGGTKPLVPYFRPVRQALQGMGVKVYQWEVPRYESVYDRAAVLHERILLMQQITGATHVNLVGHSMGGLDCRHMVTHLGGHKFTKSLTTVGTPHRGSSYAEWAVSQAERFKVDRALAAVQLEFQAYQNVRPKFLEEVFNPETPDHPEVKYFSIVGASDFSVFNPFYYPAMYIKSQEGRNDGLVSADSQRWGEVLEEVDLDHLSQHASEMCLPVYQRLLQRLVREGF